MITTCTLEFIDTVANIAGNLCICLGVVFSAWLLFFSKKSFGANYVAGRKLATIEFYRKISDDCDASLKRVEDNFKGNTAINYDDVRVGNYGKDTYDDIVTFLNRMEEMSVGINTGVFDINVFSKIAGAHSIRWFMKLKNVIEGIRKEDGYRGCYSDFEKMVDRLKY